MEKKAKFFYIDAELDQRLKLACINTGYTESDAIRTGIKAFIEAAGKEINDDNDARNQEKYQ